ncbi:MAG TPA: HAD-IIIC family phosphatase [Opitutales bacterium]|nr:HAD-IIIC family phosphatase [Opitutales bacterium]
MSDPGKNYFAEALARARAKRADGDLPAAWRELRTGLEAPAEYSSATIAAKFLENTAAGASPSGWAVHRVALIGADTLAFLRPVIRTLAFRDGWWPVFYEAPFGAWRQEILEPSSALRNFLPEITLVVRGWRAATMKKVDAAHLAGEELSLARRASEGLGLVIWPGYDLPEGDSGLRAALMEVNQRLRSALPANLLWLDLVALQDEIGAAWQDERLWEAVRQHPSPAGCVAVVEAWLALLRARWGKARKVLVTDLDNVLWGGVVGEDGVEGVQVGGDSPAGRAHWAYQQYLTELRQRGVLLAVCSKNNEADVREVFARRNLPLKREDFTGWMVNWEDKAANLRALAGKLKLGLDSLVFVDDNPAERARIRQALPEVAVPELPLDPAGYVAVLRQRRFFDTLAVSEEDRNRAAAYQAEERREELRAGTASLDDFLRSLEMTAESGEVSDATLDRVEQLLARTNQWNLTTRRHSRAEITTLLAQPGVVARWFRLRDRFGEHGLVGLWIIAPGEAGEWEIDSWIMSCRVIARGLEGLMFNSLIKSVRQLGAKRLKGVYRPTAKNGLVAKLLPGLGFSPLKTLSDGSQPFVLELAGVSESPHFIRLVDAH